VLPTSFSQNSISGTRKGLTLRGATFSRGNLLNHVSFGLTHWPQQNAWTDSFPSAGTKGITVVLLQELQKCL
jgi:hypothetical protein